MSTSVASHQPPGPPEPPGRRSNGPPSAPIVWPWARPCSKLGIAFWISSPSISSIRASSGCASQSATVAGGPRGASLIMEPEGYQESRLSAAPGILPGLPDRRITPPRGAGDRIVERPGQPGGVIDERHRGRYRWHGRQLDVEIVE